MRLKELWRKHQQRKLCKIGYHRYLRHYDSGVGQCLRCGHSPTDKEQDDYYYGRGIWADTEDKGYLDVWEKPTEY